jgi:hypothetical protein
VTIAAAIVIIFAIHSAGDSSSDANINILSKVENSYECPREELKESLKGIEDALNQDTIYE